MHEDPCWHHVCEEGSTAASDAVDLPLTRIRANILMWIPDSCFFFFFFFLGRWDGFLQVISRDLSAATAETSLQGQSRPAPPLRLGQLAVSLAPEGG